MPAGCCSLAAWWCGPDRSRWVSVDYTTPRLALDTFLEAIRRDRPIEVVESLSETLKERLGLAGIAEGTIAWQRLRETGPIHLLGSARVERRTDQADGGVRFDLAVAGREFAVVVRRSAYWHVAFTGRDGDPERLERHGSYVSPEALARMLAVNADPDTVIDLRLDSSKLPVLEEGRVREVRAGYEWKVDELIGIETAP
jgi:hypothetical protein